jgi:hypothetical protein
MATDLKTLTLTRDASTAQGTTGKITIYDPVQKKDVTVCYTIELPDKKNATNVSSIPTGTYTVVPYGSENFLVQNVLNRSGILIHKGNWAGDESLGFRSDSKGCILPGNAITKLDVPGGKKQQLAVSSSGDTLKALRTSYPHGFTLIIK